MEWEMWHGGRERWDRKGEKQDDWIVCVCVCAKEEGVILPPTGALSQGSSFRRLPTKHPWRKSCTPHNNTTAPGHPHTGNLRSFPPFQGVQTHCCCQPRAHTDYWRGGWLTGKDSVSKTQKEIWLMRTYKPKGAWFHKFSLIQITKILKRWVPERFC